MKLSEFDGLIKTNSFLICDILSMTLSIKNGRYAFLIRFDLMF